MAISPDGSKIVYVGLTAGRYRLWVRSLASDVARPLQGTEDASLPFPFWSPDSRSIGFFGGNALKRIDIESGTIRTLVTNAT